MNDHLRTIAALNKWLYSAVDTEYRAKGKAQHDLIATLPAGSKRDLLFALLYLLYSTRRQMSSILRDMVDELARSEDVKGNTRDRRH